MEKENITQPGIYSENTLVLIICGIQKKRANSFAAILAAKHLCMDWDWKGTRIRGPFLESPETIRADFGKHHNSLCIFSTKASCGKNLCSYFNFISFTTFEKTSFPE